MYILDLHVGHVGGKAQKNILSILLWAPASVGEKHCLVCPKRFVASEELGSVYMRPVSSEIYDLCEISDQA